MRLNLVALVSQTQGNLQENNRKYDFEAVSEPFTSTEDIISTCISPVNNASGTSSDDDNSNSLVVDIVQESATDSNEENFLQWLTIPIARKQKVIPFPFSQPFSYQTKVSKPHSKVIYVIRLSQNQLLRTALNLRMHAPSPSPSCQLPCCTQNRMYHPTVDELKKKSVRQTSSVGKHRQCPASIFFKYPWATYCLTQGGIACFYCKTTSEKGQIVFTNYKENAFCAGTFSNWNKWQETLKKHHKSHFHNEAGEKLFF